MNLGQLLGQQNLRIVELEEALQRKSNHVEGQRRSHTGVWAAVKAALTESADPLSIDELVQRCGGFDRKTISRNVSVRVAQKCGLERVYVAGVPRYRLS